MFPGSGISPPPLHDLTCNGSTPRLALYIHGWEDALEILAMDFGKSGGVTLYIPSPACTHYILPLFFAGLIL